MPIEKNGACCEAGAINFFREAFPTHYYIVFTDGYGEPRFIVKIGVLEACLNYFAYICAHKQANMENNSFSADLSETRSLLDSKIEEYRGDSGFYEHYYLRLTEERQALKKAVAALDRKPTVAVLGQSYLNAKDEVGIRLLSYGHSAEIEGNGTTYDYDECITVNMGPESGGNLIRFTMQSDHYSAEYPVLMRTLSVKELTLMFCDIYYNDYRKFEVMSREEADAIAGQLLGCYANMPRTRNECIGAYDIVEMKNYFYEHIQNISCFNYSFFNNLEEIIDRIPEWCLPSVFSRLWNNHPVLTPLYNLLFDILRRLHFQREIYLPIDAVLHGGLLENTILSSRSYTRLIEDDFSNPVEAFSLRENSGFSSLGEFRKSELAAICKEAVFSLKKESQNDYGEFDLSEIHDDVVGKLPETVRLDILEKADVLEFPGIKFGGVEIWDLRSIIDTVNVLSSCKAKFLYDMYEGEDALDIFLMCHDSMDFGVPYFYSVIKDWIYKHVGSNVAERSAAISSLGGQSPFFFVSTRMEADMGDEGLRHDDILEYMNLKWQKRFGQVAYKELFHGYTCAWLNSWTTIGSGFKNCYLVRNRKWSGPRNANLYSGYRETGRETGRIADDEYMDNLRKTFCESEDVRKFFSDPALSWDVATTINNDGILYLIHNLSKTVAPVADAKSRQSREKIVARLQRIKKFIEESHL